MNYNTAQPHIACYVVLRMGSKIAFVLRSNTDYMNGCYGLPSGKVEKNESFVQGAVREAKEEVGIEVKPSDLKQLITVHRFDNTSHINDWVDVYFEATKWKGKPYNAEPHLHSKLEWLDPVNLPENIVPAVLFTLSEIKKGKRYSEYGWGSKIDKKEKL
ncbi:MAG TPA: NUDIX domain-containing protein [Patescibacteria group bacterium]|nr:NUDIX domain-containing protein [Patescibacteria group bacterium]